MAKKQGSGSSDGGEGKKDRHKPARMVRIRPRLGRALDRICERDERDFVDVVNQFIREGLEKAGFWPPQEERQDEDE